MQRKRFLIKHVGNMGDHVFFIPPVLETLKNRYPNCHITLVVGWGFKDKKSRWGKRNQGGFCISLMMTNPHIDQLVHWHDQILDLAANTCIEEGKHFPTWNRAYFDAQRKSDLFDGIFELDFGINPTDNPLQRMYEAVGLPDENYSKYQLYFTDHDRHVAAEVMADAPHPRIVLLEALSGPTTREWVSKKAKVLSRLIQKIYGVAPIWFGGRFVPEYHGRQLTLRENIATLQLCDVAIGPPSGPLHFSAAVSLPTITLYCDLPLKRAAPAFFLNSHIYDSKKLHRTVLGPSPEVPDQLKPKSVSSQLTQLESDKQHFRNWTRPGEQMTKSCLAAITPSEIMTVLRDILPVD